MPPKLHVDTVQLNQRIKESRQFFYLPQLDGLRFLAFFLVFLAHNVPSDETLSGHFGPAPATAIGLIRDTAGFGLGLFFFLSSFLISSLLLIEKDTTDTVALRAFYVRRILRIWPLYFAFLICVSIIGIWSPSEHISIPRLAALSLLAGNWYFIARGMSPFIVGPLWSISVEEQFYAIWPSILRLTNRRTFVYFSLAVGVGSLATTALLAARGVSSLNIWMNSAPEFVFFAAGTLLALFFQPQRKPNLLIAILLSIFGFGVWTADEWLFKLTDRTFKPEPFQTTCAYFFAAAGCALLIAGCLYIRATLVPGWLKYLGKISYGLYVFHPLAMRFIWSTPRNWHLRGSILEIISIFFVTVALAACSYRFLERTFLRLKRRFELIATRAA